jgi:hypothetical protein
MYSAPSLGQTIKEGIGYGIGSSIGQRITTALLGAPVVAVKEVGAGTPTVASSSVPTGACSRYTELKAAMDACVKDGYDCTLQLEEYRSCLKDGSSK